MECVLTISKSRLCCYILKPVSRRTVSQLINQSVSQSVICTTKLSQFQMPLDMYNINFQNVLKMNRSMINFKKVSCILPCIKSVNVMKKP